MQMFMNKFEHRWNQEFDQLLLTYSGPEWEKSLNGSLLQQQ